MDYQSRMHKGGGRSGEWILTRTGSSGSSTSGVTSGPGHSCWECINEERYCKKECYMTGHGVKVDFGDQCAPINFGDECYPCWEAKCKGTLYPKR